MSYNQPQGNRPYFVGSGAPQQGQPLQYQVVYAYPHQPQEGESLEEVPPGAQRMLIAVPPASASYNPQPHPQPQQQRRRPNSNRPQQHQYQQNPYRPNTNIHRPHKTYPFMALSPTAEQKSYPISPSNIHCFHGFDSLLTLQHRLPFTVDGVEYKSVDHYYQLAKVRDLLGVESARFFDGSTKNYGSLAKELLRSGNVAREQVEYWRVTSGVMAIQKALLEKLKQCPPLQTALINTGEKIIAHTYAMDDFFGTGVPFKYVRDWSNGMSEKKASLVVPMSFPLTPDSVKGAPVVGKGRNVLGCIYMILREKFNLGLLNSLRVGDEGEGKHQEVGDVAQQLGDSLGLQQTTTAKSSATTAFVPPQPRPQEAMDFTMDAPISTSTDAPSKQTAPQQ